MSKTQVVKALLAAKDTNVNQAHGLFGTPLDIATKNNHTEIIQLLKDAEVQSKIKKYTRYRSNNFSKNR